MILKELSLKNFRSHTNSLITLSDKLNYFVGGNGQGKTSILESIYYLCTTKSQNAGSDSEVVAFGQDNFEIVGKFSDITDNTVRVYYTPEGNKKYYFKNEKQISKSADVIGEFPVILLDPSDHSITQGSPADRRKFVDSIISQSSKNYLLNLLDYNKTLKQRSSLLFQLKEKRTNDKFAELEAWTEKLINTGLTIIDYRKRFSKEFSSYINESYKIIMEDKEIPNLHYSTLENYDGLDFREVFTSLLNSKKDAELKRAQNLVGPHKDDFVFKINDLVLRTYGSQGQHKTFQVVLRFAEFFYLKEKTGKTPLFLLDDVFGELDSVRAKKISDYLSQVGQAFITLTDLPDLSLLKTSGEKKVIRVSKGNISYE